jgi:acyl-CoA dehydrogenase
MHSCNETQELNAIGRKHLAAWQEAIKKNSYLNDPDFKHSIDLYLSKKRPQLDQELTAFAERITHDLEPLVIENNLSSNLPRLEHDNGIGESIEKIVHHPTYEASGDIIYSSRLLERMAQPGGLLEALAFMFLSSQAGEAGHNCPIACSAGIIRILQKMDDFPQKAFYLEKLTAPSYRENFTGAQFLTEIQGGSDVGLNATAAHQDKEGRWRIKGEKWFCSNADAELILLTARYDKNIPGTKGLGLFLVPSHLESGERNYYTMRRLKDKIGTRSMASAEMDFHEAIGIAVGRPSDGFKMVMENVLHISRLFNTFCVLGMARRAYHIALAYAEHRVAFGQPIINYPLVKENLARIKAENTAMLASIFATVQLQDDLDAGTLQGDETKFLLRLLANLNKYLSAIWSVDHIHHALDTLAGNGAIESFSTIPRLLRDSIVCENWEGTHNTLHMQILRDIIRHKIDELFLNHLDQLLMKVDPSEKRLKVIKEQIEQIKKNLQLLKTMNPELQTLHIKNVVDQMAIVYSAANLLIEALNQAKSNHFSKLNCLDYFNILHFQKPRLLPDQAYLDLIKLLVSPVPGSN